jgi:hypothetical protein
MSGPRLGAAFNAECWGGSFAAVSAIGRNRHVESRMHFLKAAIAQLTEHFRDTIPIARPNSRMSAQANAQIR